MRVLEVCCGAGGLSLGLIRAGFEIGLAIDFWPDALKVYKRNVPQAKSLLRKRHHARVGDLSDLLGLVPQVLPHRWDMIAGGPPCQDFSSAGLRIEGSRADLTLAYAMFIAIIRPRWILMENVPGARKSEAWSRARTILKRAGYGLTEKVVDASYYGVPQARRRFIVVGRLDEADGFFESAIDSAKSERPMTVRDLLGDTVGVQPGGDYPRDMRVFYLRPFKGRSGVRSIDAPCPTIISKSGEPATKSYKIKHENDIIPPDQAPPLTTEQMSRIQGFPEGWAWDDVRSEGKRRQMIANAMPSPLAEAIGRLILARDTGTSIPEIEPDFVDWLSRDKKLEGQELRNRKSQLNRARRLLKGRMLADVEAETVLLKQTNEFVTLSTSVKSDLIKALRLHSEWRNHPPIRLPKPEYDPHDDDWGYDDEPRKPPNLLGLAERIALSRTD